MFKQSNPRSNKWDPVDPGTNFEDVQLFIEVCTKHYNQPI